MISLSREELETRRLEAGEFFADGNTQAFVARRFEVSRTTAARWYARWKSDDLARRKSTGRTPLLDAADLERIREIYECAPRRRFRKFTVAELAELIESEFGVKYHPDHIYRIMYRLGLWTRKSHRMAA